MLGQKPLQLEVGQTIHYKNSSMPHPEATYEGVVVKEYPHFYTVLGSPIVSTMNFKDKDVLEGKPPIPYQFCIPKYLDTRNERVHIVKEDANNKIA